jgi:hypothetical protein
MYAQIGIALIHPVPSHSHSMPKPAKVKQTQENPRLAGHTLINHLRIPRSSVSYAYPVRTAMP